MKKSFKILGNQTRREKKSIKRKIIKNIEKIYLTIE